MRLSPLPSLPWVREMELSHRVNFFSCFRSLYNVDVYDASRTGPCELLRRISRWQLVFSLLSFLLITALISHTTNTTSHYNRQTINMSGRGYDYKSSGTNSQVSQA